MEPKAIGAPSCADILSPRDVLPELLTKALIRKYVLPIGERTLDRWISAGAFPGADLAIGGKARFWKRSTVENWIERQTEGVKP